VRPDDAELGKSMQQLQKEIQELKSSFQKSGN
jgi:hypothetical protein